MKNLKEILTDFFQPDFIGMELIPSENSVYFYMKFEPDYDLHLELGLDDYFVTTTLFENDELYFNNSETLLGLNRKSVESSRILNRVKQIVNENKRSI